MYGKRIESLYLTGISPEDTDLIEILEKALSGNFTVKNVFNVYYPGNLDRIRLIGVVLKTTESERIYPAVKSITRGGNWVKIILEDYAAIPIWQAIKLLNLPKISPHTLAVQSLMWNFPVSYRKDLLRRFLDLKSDDNLEKVLMEALSDINKTSRRKIGLKENQEACTFYWLDSSSA